MKVPETGESLGDEAAGGPAVLSLEFDTGGAFKEGSDLLQYLGPLSL